MEDNWVSILSTSQPWQADMAKQILAENGIEAVVLNKRDSSYTVFGEIEIYVSQEDAEKSKNLLKNIEN
ncbi:MAG TPA: hypothetical protein DIW31_01175 [Bacteroidales bacterium]|nr:hypothetical protein [Bacteroidales bacterium]